MGRRLISSDLKVEEVMYVSENLSLLSSQNATDAIDVELLFIIFKSP
jgi:hypothetical protein